MSIWRTLVFCAVVVDAVGGSVQQQHHHQTSDKLNARNSSPVSHAARMLGSGRVLRREIPPPGDAAGDNTILPAVPPKTPHSIGIAQDGNDETYFVIVKFGPDKKDFKLIVDSGSTNTWIAKDTCQSVACTTGKVKTYGPGDSKSLKITEDTFNVQYGNGAVVGLIVEDVIEFAGFKVAATFGLATAVSDIFVDAGIDGVLGLGPDVGVDRGATIMDQLAKQKFISKKLYGVALSHAEDEINDGVINFGAVDTSKFTGELKFTMTLLHKGLWELPVGSVSVDGAELNFTHSPTAIVDTGTTSIFMPLEDCVKLHAKIPSAIFYADSFLIPCNTTLPIQISFSGVKYTIPARDYIGSIISTPDNPSSPINGFCKSLIGPQIFLGNTIWVFGDVFLKNVYSVFDLDNRRVGFAPRKRPPQDGNPKPKPTRTTSGADVAAMTLAINLVDSSLTGDAAGSIKTTDVGDGGGALTTTTSNLAADNGGGVEMVVGWGLMVALGFAAVYMNA